VVYWGGVEVGKGPVVENSLEPDFSNFKLIVPDVGDWDTSSLEFKVWDHNKAPGSRDALVGEFEISGGYLLHLRSAGTELLPLRLSKDDPHSPKRGVLEVGLSLGVAEFAFPTLDNSDASNLLATVGGGGGGGGSAEATAAGGGGGGGGVGSADMKKKSKRSSKRLRLRIVNASGLAAADDDTGASDPYCVVYFNDAEVGRTPVMFETLNPAWPDDGEATFQVDAPTDPLQAELVIDVYDFDEEGAHDFLGKVVLNGSSLARPPKGRMSCVLQKDVKSKSKSKAGKGGGGAEQQRREHSKEKSNRSKGAAAAPIRSTKFVQGKIEVELSYLEVTPEELALEQELELNRQQQQEQQQPPEDASTVASSVASSSSADVVAAAAMLHSDDDAAAKLKKKKKDQKRKKKKKQQQQQQQREADEVKVNDGETEGRNGLPRSLNPLDVIVRTVAEVSNREDHHKRKAAAVKSYQRRKAAAAARKRKAVAKLEKELQGGGGGGEEGEDEEEDDEDEDEDGDDEDAIPDPSVVVLGEDRLFELLRHTLTSSSSSGGSGGPTCSALEDYGAENAIFMGGGGQWGTETFVCGIKDVSVVIEGVVVGPQEGCTDLLLAVQRVKGKVVNVVTNACPLSFRSHSNKTLPRPLPFFISSCLVFSSFLFFFLPFF
jgi:hypothetical protein